MGPGTGEAGRWRGGGEEALPLLPLSDPLLELEEWHILSNRKAWSRGDTGRAKALAGDALLCCGLFSALFATMGTRGSLEPFRDASGECERHTPGLDREHGPAKGEVGEEW